VVPGLVHRYPDRVLMVLTDICPCCAPLHAEARVALRGMGQERCEIQAMMDYIRIHPEVRDVIISAATR